MTSEARLHEASLLAMLLDAPSVGPHKANSLLSRHGSVEGAIEGLRRSTSSERIRDYFTATSVTPYRESIERTWQLGGRVLLWQDAEYPSNLDAWSARPPLLFVKGDLRRLQRRSLALVGRVDPDEAGTRAARRFAEACVNEGITVVSGLARGIDAASHRGALDAGGYTYAVIAHGLDHAYPKENSDLYEQIVERGALITQFRTGVGPQRWTFPMRNELMCTLALGTAIVQGAEKCGSNIQADFSFKHSRPVFVLSKNLRDMPPWAVRHVEKGATVVQYFDDVLEVIDSDHEPRAVQQDLLADIDNPSEADLTKCAIFDLDGVIIDTREATARALLDVARAHGAEAVTLAEARRMATISPPKALSALGVSEGYGAYKHAYNDAFAKHLEDVQTNAEMIAIVRNLADEGYHLGIVTSQPRYRAERMIPRELEGVFSQILTYSEVKRDKASGITRIMNGGRGTTASTVYIGDTPGDIVAARRAGVRSIGVLWGFSAENELATRSPDVLSATPAELRTAIHELTGSDASS